MFDSLTDAHSAVRELVDIGIPRNDISLVTGDAKGEYTTKDGTLSNEMNGTATGAGTGAILGGLGGLLVGLGTLAIPGIGPLIALGPLATTLLGAGVGAAAGGLLGSLTDIGVPEEEANYYVEGVRRGGVLVTVQANDEMMVDRTVNILERHNAVDVKRRASDWQKTGWTRFDPSAEPYRRPEPQRQSTAAATSLTGTTTVSKTPESQAVAATTGRPATATAQSTATASSSQPKTAGEQERAIPVVEEEL